MGGGGGGGGGGGLANSPAFTYPVILPTPPSGSCPVCLLVHKSGPFHILVMSANTIGYNVPIARSIEL